MAGRYRPGVLLVTAIFELVRLLSIDDLPTLLRPTKATSGRPTAGGAASNDPVVLRVKRLHLVMIFYCCPEVKESIKI